MDSSIQRILGLTLVSVAIQGGNCRTMQYKARVQNIQLLVEQAPQILQSGEQELFEEIVEGWFLRFYESDRGSGVLGSVESTNVVFQSQVVDGSTSIITYDQTILYTPLLETTAPEEFILRPYGSLDANTRLSLLLSAIPTWSGRPPNGFLTVPVVLGALPTNAPTTMAPTTLAPITLAPTTLAPSSPAPTAFPTAIPTIAPTGSPAVGATSAPSVLTTVMPTVIQTTFGGMNSSMPVLSPVDNMTMAGGLPTITTPTEGTRAADTESVGGTNTGMVVLISIAVVCVTSVLLAGLYLLGIRRKIRNQDSAAGTTANSNTTPPRTTHDPPSGPNDRPNQSVVGELVTVGTSPAVQNASQTTPPFAKVIPLQAGPSETPTNGQVIQVDYKDQVRSVGPDHAYPLANQVHEVNTNNNNIDV